MDDFWSKTLYIKENNSIVINDELFVNISKVNEGYIFDFYPMDDPQNLITSATIWEDDYLESNTND